MSIQLALVVAVAGGVGALCRWAWGQTLWVNVVGSFLAGLVLAIPSHWWPGLGPVLSTGFLGGFTTFSTAMVEHVDAPDRTTAWNHTMAMLGLCLLAAWVGCQVAAVVPL